MRKLLRWALPCLCFAAICIGCSDDKNEGDGERQGKPVSELTPDENKKELETIGLKVLAEINPADHENLLRTLDKFSEFMDCGDISLERNETKAAKSVAKSIRRICGKNDLGGMMAFTRASSDLYRLAQYYGIYTYNEARNEWVRTDSNNNLEFHFKVNGKAAVVKVTASGKEVAIDNEDDNEQYMVPEKAEGIITLNGDELCKVSANSKLNKSSHTADVTANITASGYSFNVTVNASETKGSCDFKMTKGNKTIITATASINGQRMTNPTDNDIDNPENLFKDATAKVDIMGEANITASCSNIKKMIDESDNIYYSYSEDPYDELWSKDEAEIYNKYLKAELRYNGSDAVIATFGFQAYEEDYGWDEKNYWDIEPIIIFTNDDSIISFEDYFDDEVGFKELIDSIEDLGNQYEIYLDYLLDDNDDYYK